MRKSGVRQLDAALVTPGKRFDASIVRTAPFLNHDNLGIWTSELNLEPHCVHAPYPKLCRVTALQIHIHDSGSFRRQWMNVGTGKTQFTDLLEVRSVVECKLKQTVRSAEIQFGADVLPVGFDRAHTDSELVGDFLAGGVFSDQL